MRHNNYLKSAFTLIELSIALVIIGIIVGGVLVGRDLIAAAEVRAQVSQFEQLQTSVNTFKLKYNGLPGDLDATTASSLGFFTLSGGRGRGDGNGILESGYSGCNVSGATNCFYGEFSVFFRHLSDSKLIEGLYSYGNIINGNGNPNTTVTSITIGNFIPAAKIGRSAYITVNSYNGINYFTLGGFIGFSANGYYGNPGGSNPLSANESFQIDSKIDDGKPNSGGIRAINIAQDISSNLQYWVETSGLPNCVTGGTDYILSNTNIGACSLSVKIK